jgi:hypothetical protein
MNDYLSKEDLAYMEEMRLRKEERRKLSEIASNLKFTTVNTNSGNILIPFKELWDLLSNEKELRKLISRVKNKAFW